MSKLLFSILTLYFMMKMTSSAGILATYSQPCQKVIRRSGHSLISTPVCKSETLAAGFQWIVKFGFCTESEFNNFTSTLCDQVYSHSTTVSKAKTNFYFALNKTSDQCQNKSLDCVQTSIFSFVFKQQEQFCPLFNFNVGGTSFQSCMTSEQKGCTPDEFNELKTAACTVTTTSVDQTFSKALLKTTSKCQSLLHNCSKTIPPAFSLLVYEKYCNIMTFNKYNIFTEACLRMGATCTVAEIDNLKVAACNLATMKTFSLFSICTTLAFTLFFQM